MPLWHNCLSLYLNDIMRICISHCEARVSVSHSIPIIQTLIVTQMTIYFENPVRYSRFVLFFCYCKYSITPLLRSQNSHFPAIYYFSCKQGQITAKANFHQYVSIMEIFASFKRRIYYLK